MDMWRAALGPPRKHKLMQDFLAHRPGADPPKPAPSVKKERARTAQPQSKEDVDEKTIVAGSKRQGAAAAMRVAAATPGMKSAAAAPTNQPPVHDDVDADADARTAAKAEAKKKAKATAEAEQARAKAEAARKSKAEAEKKKAETERKQKEADERRATEARKAAASPPAKSTAPQATSVVTPAAAAPAGGAADWPTLAGVPARLVKEAERCLTDGNFGGAAEGFDEAISSLEDAEPKFDVVRCDLYVKRADCLLHDGQPRQAAEDCTKALALNPIHHEALLRRGRVSAVVVRACGCACVRVFCIF
jgi:tetratricopeptide (TPR) repeat protein